MTSYYLTNRLKSNAIFRIVKDLPNVRIDGNFIVATFETDLTNIEINTLVENIKKYE